jgi:predicted lipoprotein with Yx(FWY)xxD motif
MPAEWLPSLAVLSSTSSPLRRLFGGCACAMALALAAACGGPAAPAAPTTAADAAAASHAAAGHDGGRHQGGRHGGDPGAVELYAVQTGTLGIVVTDGAGRLLYGSTQDANNPPTSRCTGQCAQEWLPLVVPAGREPDLLGIDPETVGRVARDDGSSQLTLGGWPVYVNKNDEGDKTAAAPDARGAWFAMTPQGEKVAL